jgi:hypothetical protein
LVIGVLLVVGVAAVAVVLLLGTSGDHGHGAASTSSVPPATGQVITARNGTISLTLPSGWRGADLSNGVQGVASELFPDNPDAAAKIEQRLTVLPRAVVLFGARLPSTPNPPAFLDNVNVLADPTAPASLTIDEVGPAEAHGIAQFATVTGQGVVDLGARRAYRIVYKTPAFAGVAYIIKGTEDTWVLTYSFGPAGADLDLAQSSASTFEAP